MQVEGQDGAKYKSFETREEAAEAFEKGYSYYLKAASSAKAASNLAPQAPIGKPINESLASMLPAAVIRGIWSIAAFTRLPDRKSSISGR